LVAVPACYPKREPSVGLAPKSDAPSAGLLPKRLASGFLSATGAPNSPPLGAGAELPNNPPVGAGAEFPKIEPLAGWPPKRLGAGWAYPNRLFYWGSAVFSGGADPNPDEKEGLGSSFLGSSSLAASFFVNTLSAEGLAGAKNSPPVLVGAATTSAGFTSIFWPPNSTVPPTGLNWRGAFSWAGAAVN
jgi:hypothetical protein